MGKPCIAFSMDNAMDAWNHIRGNMETVVEYGDEFEGKDLYTWDDGERTLYRCKLCGGYVLWQNSEFHSFTDSDSYYTDVFPVSGEEEAEEINRRWDGWEIEDEFPGRYLIQDNHFEPHWSGKDKETEKQGNSICNVSEADYMKAALYVERCPGMVVREDLRTAKLLGNARPNGRYYLLHYRYKNFFERFLKEQLSLDLIDQNLKASDLDFRPVKEKDQDYYQRTSGMGLAYIYLRNNLYVEKLTEEELYFLEQHGKYGAEVEEFVKNTCDRVVNPYDEPLMIFYGPENGKFLFDSDEIVLGIRYAEFDTELEDEAFTISFLQKQQLISKISLVVKAYGLQKLEKKVSLVQYNEASIMQRYEE